MNAMMDEEYGNKKKPATPAPEIANAPSQEDAGAQAAADQTGNEDGGMGGEAASPELQEAYDRVVLAGMRVLHDDATHQQVVQALQSGEPAQAIASLVSTIMVEMDRQSGGEVPEEVIIPASLELLERAAEMAQKLGAQIDDTVLAAAAQQLVLKLAQEYGIDPADAQAAIGKMDPAKVQEMVGQQQQIASTWAGGAKQPQQPEQPPMGAQ